LLSRADEQALERMAVAWAAFRAASILINKAGLLTRGANGEPVRNPLLLVQATAAGEMHACGMVLGLSPLARTRLTAPDEQEADPLSVLLGPHGKAWGDERIPIKN
jgi:P27 family predicted phage terminase small subunit